MKPNTKDFEKRIETYLKESNKIAKRLKLKIRPVINFNNPKRKIPMLGRIAIFLLKRSGGFIDTHFINTK
jgi:hypothetical protein